MNSEQPTVSTSDAPIVIKEKKSDEKGKEEEEEDDEVIVIFDQNEEIIEEIVIKDDKIEKQKRDGIVVLVDEGEDYIEEVAVHRRNCISQIMMLQAFRSFIISLDMGQLLDIKRKIEMKMKKTRNETIPTKNILIAFSPCLHIIKRNVSINLRIDGSFRLRDFLQLFHQFMASLNIVALKGFVDEIKKDMDDDSIIGKAVTTGIIKRALDLALTILID